MDTFQLLTPRGQGGAPNAGGYGQNNSYNQSNSYSQSPAPAYDPQMSEGDDDLPF